MNLLVCNDDGVAAEGIRVLAGRLSEEHNVYVVAPASNRSAVSHCITMYAPLEIKKIQEHVWSCSGMPADCVITGIRSNLLPCRVDAVVSGINCGANMGTDIIYSGTCAAARQATLYGIPSVALSVDPVDWDLARREGIEYAPLADFAARNLEKLLSLCSAAAPRTFVNVNAASLKKYKGWRFTGCLCERVYNDSLEVTEDCGCLKASFRSGGTQTVECPESDFSAASDGYISVSCVYADPLCIQSVDGVTFSL